LPSGVERLFVLQLRVLEIGKDLFHVETERLHRRAAWSLLDQVIVAVSGLKGDSEELETMLQARAWVVRDYLVSNFRMDDKRVKTMIRGKSAARTDDGTVDILIYRK
jgi:hypothetical protein